MFEKDVKHFLIAGNLMFL